MDSIARVGVLSFHDMKDKYAIVLRRHDEDTDSDEYSNIGYSTDPIAARESIRSFQAIPEDIFYICDMAYISEINKYSSSVWVADDSGAVRQVWRTYKGINQEYEYSISYGWENHDQWAMDMIWHVAKLNYPKLLILKTLLSCFRLHATVDGLQPKEEDRFSFSFLRTLEYYFDSLIDDNQLKREAIVASRCLGGDPQTNASMFLYHCAMIVLSEKFIMSNAYDAMSAIVGIGNISNSVFLEKIRQEIPLRKLLVASL